MANQRTEDEEIVAEIANHMARGGRQVQVSGEMAGRLGVATGAADFCTVWPTAKAVLEFLKDKLPPLVRKVVDFIIRAGDRVCAN
jgi:hypothetical protein